jgi:acyl-CoA thioesterase I
MLTSSRRIGLATLVVTLLLPALLLAQNKAPITVMKYKAPIKVSCVGDSITQGVGAGDGPWPVQLQKLLGEKWDVKNFGVGGTTLMKSGDMPYQRQGAFANAKALNPDVVVIMLGTNDTKPNNWKNFEKDFDADYRDMVRQFEALSSKPRVFICRPPYIAGSGNWGINEPNTVQEIAVVDKVAKEMKLGLVDVHAALKGKDNLIPDRVHPNKDGQTEIAKAVFKALTGKNPSGAAK